VSSSMEVKKLRIFEVISENSNASEVQGLYGTSIRSETSNILATSPIFHPNLSIN
jgi:hypothetical protein